MATPPTTGTTAATGAAQASPNGQSAHAEADREAVIAEQAYLAIMLEYASRTDPKEFLRVIEGVDVDDILRPAHREVFEAVIKLWNDGDGMSVVDPDAVWQELARRAREAVPPATVAFGIEGPHQLVRLLGISPTISRADHYAQLIRGHAQHRRERDLVDGMAREIAGARRPDVLAELNTRLAATLAAEPRQWRLSAVAASTMTMRAAKWLYRLRIPAGGISLLAGREGIGKSTISYDVVAKVTRGELDGRYLGIPRGVAVVATEDAWAEVIVPRLVAARADLTRVFRIDVKDSGGGDVINVPADLAELGRVCVQHDIALLVLDPVMSVIDGSIDTHKDREVRKALDPLSKFAVTHTVAVLGLIHANKNTGADPLNSIMGSKAFTAVARSILYCLADPTPEDGQESYLFCHPKSNLGPKQKSERYHLIEVKIDLDPATVEPGDDAVVVTSRVVWDGDDERSAQDVMDAGRLPRPTGDLAGQILAFIRGRAGVVQLEEIAAEFDDVPDQTLRQNLSRMVKRGELVRPSRGVYGATPRKGGGSL